ncbi:ribosomal l22e protein family domain-containing protein [Ditylenchus destructor]|nr:ribosomal l22e protein family domain-containing protein [Ditylenchus destructor]
MAPGKSTKASATASKPAAAKPAPAKPAPAPAKAAATAAPAKPAVVPKAAAEKPVPKPAPQPVAPVAKPKVKAKTVKKPVKPKKTIAKKTVTGGKKKKKQALAFHIECKNPVEDGILKTSSFETFLNEAIKVNGKTKQLALNGITVDATKTKITVASESQPLSKRYLKYLTKKYLKRNSLRDWLRVVASTKDTYELRYFQINQDEDEESENES